MTIQSGTETTARRQKDTRRRSIALDVVGGDLMLRGRFSSWESGLSLGPDLDQVGLRLAIDATSAGPIAGDNEPPLFTFRSREVEAEGIGAYRAQGTFTGPGGVHPADVTVETPPGHSALFVLSFAAEKRDFGSGWRDLVENVVPSMPSDDGEPVRSAHAWLTTPVLAAA
jgi:hypothetical protein